VELAAAIAWENYRARSNRVFGFGSEGFYQEAMNGSRIDNPKANT
jgi:hypothetical protein